MIIELKAPVVMFLGDGKTITFSKGKMVNYSSRRVDTGIVHSFVGWNASGGQHLHHAETCNFGENPEWL